MITPNAKPINAHLRILMWAAFAAVPGRALCIGLLESDGLMRLERMLPRRRSGHELPRRVRALSSRGNASDTGDG